MKFWTAATTAIVTVLVLAGCGATKTMTVTVASVTTKTDAITQTETVVKTVRISGPTTPSTTPQAAAVSTSSPNGKLKTIRDFNGNTLDVEVGGLIDPAAPANNLYAPAAGDRLVAVKLGLIDQGPGSISSDADADTEAIGSDGQDYDPSFDDISGCTNFDAGTFSLTLNADQVGCVIFEMPDSVTISEVQFSLGGNTINFNP